MVERWPDSVILSIASVPTQNASGDIVAGLITSGSYKCRIRPALLGGNWLDGENGKTIIYKYTISIPNLTPLDYSLGQATFNTITYPILKYVNYQNRTKIWV